ncbi:MAG: flavodoxin family protein [Tissierellia bacterium]|nr:flavodoxin family protein [Tissierellia bacterium]
MNIFIASGSPRKNGNTQQLTDIVHKELTKLGHHIQEIWLHDKKIEPCIACRKCQRDWTSYGCFIKDDMQEIVNQVMESDIIVLATPIYAWYCTPPMKAMIDRFVYGLNKFYGDEIGPSLWKGKTLALITTCGYRPEKGADLFEEGMKRYAKHCNLNYSDMLCARHLGYNVEFMDKEKEDSARNFAHYLHSLQL